MSDLVHRADRFVSDLCFGLQCRPSAPDIVPRA